MAVDEAHRSCSRHTWLLFVERRGAVEWPLQGAGSARVGEQGVLAQVRAQRSQLGASHIPGGLVKGLAFAPVVAVPQTLRGARGQWHR